jgi:hypothetical protein
MCDTDDVFTICNFKTLLLALDKEIFEGRGDDVEADRLREIWEDCYCSPNGGGSFDQFLPFFCDLSAICKQHPAIAEPEVNAFMEQHILI